MVDADLAAGEAGHLDVEQSTGERLGRVADQPWRRASQQEKPRGHFGSICQNAQEWKKLGQKLHLIEYYPPTQRCQRSHRVVLKPASVQVVLQVEPVRIGPAFVIACEGCLPALAGPQEQGYRRFAKALVNAAQ